MSTRRSNTGPLSLLLLALAACEPGVTTPETDTSFFRASIDGAINAQFEGSGYFILGTDARRPAAPSMFSLFSEGRGSSAGLVFQLFRPGSELPEVGTYSLGAFVGPTGGEFKASLDRTGRYGDTLETFTSSGGELEITLATPERIEGRFRMSAYRSGGQVSQGMYLGGIQPGPDTPRIEVSGSFGADFVRGSPVRGPR